MSRSALLPDLVREATALLGSMRADADHLEEIIQDIGSENQAGAVPDSAIENLRATGFEIARAVGREIPAEIAFIGRHELAREKCST